MTVSAFTSVSLDPLLVLICVEKITRFHEAVLASGLWAVSVLAEDAEEVSRWFAVKARPTGGQLADYAHHPGPTTGMPVLDCAMAVIECQTRAVYDGGDHSIVLGDVVGLELTPSRAVHCCTSRVATASYDEGIRRRQPWRSRRSCPIT